MKTTKLLLAGLMYGLKILSPCLITFNSVAQSTDKALQFDGINDYLNIPNSTSLQFDTSSITIEAWLYPTSFTSTDAPTYVRWFGKENFCLGWKTTPSCTWLAGQVSSTGVVNCGGRGWGDTLTFAFSSSITITTNNWYHIAIVIDRSSSPAKGFIYVNGVNGSGAGKDLTGLSGVLNMTNGLWFPSTFAEYKGAMDEIRVWKTVRTQTQIRDNMCQQLTGSETDLVGYWRMDEGSGSKANDSSPNGNNGTLTYMNTTTAWVASGAATGGRDVKISSNATDFCIGDTLVLNTDTGFSSYLWQDSTILPTFAVTTAGTYWVEIVDSNCFSSDTIVIVENALPTIELGNAVSLCLGMDTLLDAGAGYVSYAWSNGDTTQTITVNATNTYSVIVTDTNSCSNSDTISVTVSPCLGISDQYPTSDNQYQVFPNPSDGTFEISINYTELKVEILQLVIYDVLGKSVYQQTINTKQQILNTKLNKGIYFLQVISDDGIWNEKVIVNY